MHLRLHIFLSDTIHITQILIKHYLSFISIDNIFYFDFIFRSIVFKFPKNILFLFKIMKNIKLCSNKINYNFDTLFKKSNYVLQFQLKHNLNFIILLSSKSVVYSENINMIEISYFSL